MNLAHALLLSGRTNEAARSFAQALAIEPDLADQFLRDGERLLQQGHWTASLARFKTALSLQPNAPETQRWVAWVLATHPQDSLRNGPEALRLAQSALASVADKASRYWAAVDVAYAEVGNFEKAIEAAEKTVEVAGRENQPATAAAAAARIALYREKKPFHQPLTLRFPGARWRTRNWAH